MTKLSLKKQIIKNVEEDRKRSDEFINNISVYLSTNDSTISGLEYAKIVESASKLMEARQRSNEQIVKIFDIVSKKKPALKPNTTPTQEEIDEALNSDQVVEMGDDNN